MCKFQIGIPRTVENLTDLFDKSIYKMPTSLYGYQRILVRGVPVWKKEDNLYLYDTDVNIAPIKIGSLSGGFSENWGALCEEKLKTYRGDSVVRTRRTGTGSKKK